MKITQDLRTVIRAKGRSFAAHNSWEKRQAQRIQAIRTLLDENPKWRAKIRAAHKRLAFLNREKEKALKIFMDLGIHTDLKGFYDEAIFVKAGGVLPVEPGKFNAERLISDLAGLNEPEALALLKTHGIIWT